MEIRRRLHVILTLLWIFQGDTERLEIPRREMEVVEGQRVVLQAWYSPRTDIAKNSVMWNFDNEARNLHIISFSSGEVGGPIIPNEFTHRVNFSKAMPSANLSIYINNTQESDSGRYTCDVLYFGDSGLTSFKGNLLLNVKVPPSPPVCTMTGEPVLKGNVTLSCKSNHGKPVPQYKWTKIAPVSEVFFSPMQNERQGTLRLSNLTKNMSGKFVCRAINTAGSNSCSINLEVITSSNTGMIAVATLGSIVGLVAMLLFLIFILRRNRDTEEEIANEIKEDAQAPKRVSWAKSNSGSDLISKNGTLSSIGTSPQSQDPHQPNFHYPYSPISPVSSSDMGSMKNAYQLQPGETNPLQGLPGYHPNGTPSHKLRPPSMNGGPRHTPRRPRPHTPIRTEGAKPQVPHPLTVSPPISSMSLTDMGGVTVMVPTKSQAGSLV